MMMNSALSERRDLEMDGCVPKEMLSYLKALGVLKAIAEGADMGARGFWRGGDQWVVRSVLDKDGALDFFMSAYRPTPVMSPWNNGSGFQCGASSGKTAKDTMGRIIAEEDPRLEDWRTIHDAARRAVKESRNKKETERKTGFCEGAETHSLTPLSNGWTPRLF